MKFVTLKSFDKKKLLIPTLIVTSLILVVTIFVSHAEFTSTDHVTIVDGVINYTPYDFKMMAMYQQKENCTDLSSDACYEETEVMPSEGYSINQDKSYCYKTNPEEKITDKVYTNSAGEHIIKDLEKNTKCVLYFEISNFYDQLSICQISSDIITEEQAQNCLVKENGYRFEGPNPNNYVLFNDELWRIIGVFNVETSEGKKENLIKLIKNENIGNSVWDDTGSNNWEKPAIINTLLNNDYLNSTGSYTTNGLNKVKDNLASVKLNIGEVNDQDYLSTIYQNERQAITNQTYKVGLMNVSDYCYASLTTTCSRDIVPFRYYTAGCYDKNWIYDTNTSWSINPYVTEDVVQFLNTGGNFSGIVGTAILSIRPTIYLKSNISLTEGTGSGDPGSSTNPYIVN